MSVESTRSITQRLDALDASVAALDEAVRASATRRLLERLELAETTAKIERTRFDALVADLVNHGRLTHAEAADLGVEVAR